MKKIKQQKLQNIGEGDLQAIADILGGLLDKQAATLASKKDLQGLENKVEGLASKQDLTDLETRLNTRMDEGFESVMAGMDVVADKLTEKDKFERLVGWAKQVGPKVGIRLKI